MDGTDPTVVTQFRELFEGRSDAHGKVWGESIKTEVSQKHFEAHLSSTLPVHSLGIYPTIENHQLAESWTAKLGRPVPPYFVKWGCTDLDDGYDVSLPLAINLQNAANMVGLDLWIEKTKGKGFHCWLFADEWVPAEVMRRCLLAVHQIAGVTPTEVNPKQLDLSKLRQGLGNYVNLPYAASAPEGKRVMIEPYSGQIIPLDLFLRKVETATFERLFEVASLYQPPPKKAVHNITEPTVEAVVLAKKLSGLAYKIWKEGPLEGRDRSTTLARLAHLIAESGTLTPGEGMVLLRDADSRWGKFWERSDCDEQLEAMIQAAGWSS